MRARLEAIDLQIRRGQIAPAAHALREIPFAELAPALRPRFAALARRANLVALSLKALAPSIHGVRAATAIEKLEYAAGLLRLGLRREALATLGQLHLPLARLHLAFGHFAEWDYAAAIPHLETFIAAPGLTEYQRLIGCVNLAAALAATHDRTRARVLVEDTMRASHALEHARIRANLREIRAQIDIAEGDFERAGRDLEAAREAIGADAPDALLIEKWSAIAHAFKTGDVAHLAMFRERALRAREWESVREADYFRLRIAFDPGLLAHLWFGTPHRAYRARLERELGRPDTNRLLWGDGPARDLTDELGSFTLERVLSSLTRDLYRPALLGLIFEEVFPTERFDIFSSPNRVHQSLWRLRARLAKLRVPLVITHDDAGYALARSGPIALVIGEGARDPARRDWETLLDRLAGRPTFTARDVEGALGISRSGARRLLRWAQETKGLTREGRGPAVTYRIAS